jgi:hypothetical protein
MSSADLGTARLCLEDGLVLWGSGTAPGAAAAIAAHAAEVARLPADPPGYAARLYAALREMDRKGVARILVEAPPADPEWAAVHDRLRRASAPRDAV